MRNSKLIASVSILFLLSISISLFFAFGKKQTDFVIFKNAEFSIAYPKNAVDLGTNEPFVIFLKSLPIFENNTNLQEKLFSVSIEKWATNCEAVSYGAITSSRKVILSGFEFLKQEAAGAGAGNFYETVNYSAMKNGSCYRLQFLLHSTNPSNYEIPPKTFNKEMEAKIFDDISKAFIIF